MNTRYIHIITFLFIASACANTDTYRRVGGDHLFLKNSEKALFWFDGIHCNDPKHRMFDDIQQKFAEFHPDLILAEGGHDGLYQSREDAILRGGEPGYVSYLGHLQQLPVLDIEPPLQKQYAYLLGKYQSQDVLAMYLIRQICQIQREEKDTSAIRYDFMAYALGFVNQRKEEGFPILAEIDAAYIQTLLLPHLHQEITNENWRQIDVGKIIYFNTEPNVIHDIWRDTTTYRDDYCVALIADLSRAYRRIFVMMGGDHIKNQKTRLEEIYR